MLRRIQKSRAVKVVAIYLAINLLFSPNMVFALTGGPSQPEVQSFAPIGTSEMVDPFTGDFNYNIPLIDVGGYPINLIYNAGIGMDQEASWVGLGWNINPGVINRSMRGIPDDFAGEQVKKEFNMNSNETYTVKATATSEIFGIDPKDIGVNLEFGLGLSYNNYVGVGLEKTMNMQTYIASPGKGDLTANLGVSSGTDGLSLKPSISYERRMNSTENKDIDLNSSVGVSFNSRAGLSTLTFSAEAKSTYKGFQSSTGSTSTSINFGTPTYVPNISMPMTNFSASVATKFGGTFFGIDPTLGFSGGYSRQALATKEQNITSYGYMYTQNGQGANNVILDFNRENDGGFSKNTPALPLTNQTYDVYAVSGQGIGGTYRPFRSDVGNVFDNQSFTTSASFSLGLEFAVGNTAHNGADINVTDVFSTSGKWTDLNGALPYLSAGSGDEPTYFKQVGETSVDEEPTFFNNYGDFDAVRMELADVGGMEIAATNTIKRGYSGTSSTLPASNKRQQRVKRNQLMSFLTKSQVAKFGAQNYASDYTYTTDAAKSHHMGEISILKEDGSRYVYGLPLYNTFQREATFNVSGRSNNCITGLVTYSDGDDSKENHQGFDNYYSSTEIQPYAHSYLLTAVLSVDYVDLTGNGPSDDDLGDYKLFKYTKDPIPYDWRVPLGENQANFNEGLKSSSKDNKGSYIYGKKELRYLEKIETKNYIAIFDTENRDDAKGVLDKNGEVVASSSMKVLKKISLYTKPDYKANELDLSNATPIKEVHFNYDYSLCPGVPNNLSGGGKLTLKEVYFTYGKSKKGKLSPYKFSYNGLNPLYNLKGYDRWGNYKPNDGTGCGVLDPINTSEFPYVEQSDITNDYASAWSLTGIELPSGGSIQVNYESDDYAYVQNKRAMQMFKIVAVSSSSTLPTINTNPHQEKLMKNDNTVNNYLWFEIPSGTNIGDLFSIGKLYFRFLVDMTTSGNYEYVSGYANMANSFTTTVGSITYGCVVINTVSQGDGGGSSVHPISKAAWQFGRLNTPRLVFDQPNLEDNAVDNILATLTALLGTLTDVKEAFQGPNGTLKGKGYGKNFIANKSWIRLNEPTKKKKGGGARVNKIEIQDNWGDMTTASTGSFSYGQEYFYDTNGDGTGYSTGVAAYEPILGGDENSWKQPIAFSDEHLLAPDDEHYMETPLGESFFPAPTVGYSRVTVRNLQRNNVNRNATGKVVHEFYTAYDFPTKVRETDLDKKPKKTNPIIKLFTFKDKDYMTASQGFAIELNDMHGKPKAQWVYAENKAEAISGIEYKYSANGNTLNNNFKTIHKNGTITTNMIGVEHELVADTREQKTSITNVGTNGNVAGFLAIFFPLVIPTILPSYNNEETRFRSASMTKVIRRYGILEETIAHDLGSRVSTKNLAYDSETGEVLLTETINNFEDPIYSLKYPAHWAYDRMGQAYKNIGKTAIVDLSSNGVISYPENLFVEGDEVAVNDTERGWVTSVVPGNSGRITVVNKDGVTFLGTQTLIRVIRSGRRNMQTVAIGSLTTKTNPLTNFSVNIFEDVINSNVIEFSEDWKTFCDCMPLTEEDEMTTNPYLLGTKGNWRPKRSLLFLTDRIQTRENDNTNIRKDGTYKNYSPFWKLNNNGSKWMKDETNWTFTTEITTYSPQGFELENKDALGRYSAAIYGYNNSLPMAVTSNSKYQEAGFDNFEDYDFGTCDDDHFSYKKLAGNITGEESHSGRRSIMVPANNSVEVIKYLDECPEELPQ